MSRSVDYLNRAETVIFFTADWVKEDYDYENFEDNLKSEICHRLRSYCQPRNVKFNGRETKVILENNLCMIGVSEYCGAWSLSVAPLDEDYYLGYNREALSKKHANLIQATLEKCLIRAGAKILKKIGTFSNGEAVYEYKK